jgi:hypothetical protein
MWREDVDAIEERCTAHHFLQCFADLATHIGAIVESSLAVFQLAAKVGTGVEPEASCLLGFVTGTVQVMQAIRQAV